MSSRKKMTHQERRNLDVEIGFLEGLVQRDPAYVDALQVLGDDYTRRGRYQEGLGVDQRLVGLRPEDPTVLYNLACSYALTEQYERAAETLNRALDQGYQDFKWLAKDPDLDDLRKQPCWQPLKARIEELSRS